jgi:3-hydroxymyristoyl/3-hydroxydecanoyl-(acyl carrier protein) dehydratase
MRTEEATESTFAAVAPGHRLEDVAVGASGATALVSPAALGALSAGHFCGDPLLPGSHLVALLADLATRYRCVSGDRDTRVVRLERCLFREPVRPQASLTLRVTQSPGDAFVRGEALLGGRWVARARLIFG